MIVKKLESPVYYRRHRQSLRGQGGAQAAPAMDKSFDQYMLEAFQGEVVQEGKQFSKSVSSLTRENLIRLGQL